MGALPPRLAEAPPQLAECAVGFSMVPGACDVTLHKRHGRAAAWATLHGRTVWGPGADAGNGSGVHAPTHE